MTSRLFNTVRLSKIYSLESFFKNCCFRWSKTPYSCVWQAKTEENKLPVFENIRIRMDSQKIVFYSKIKFKTFNKTRFKIERGESKTKLIWQTLIIYVLKPELYVLAYSKGQLTKLKYLIYIRNRKKSKGRQHSRILRRPQALRKRQYFLLLSRALGIESLFFLFLSYFA